MTEISSKEKKNHKIKRITGLLQKANSWSKNKLKITKYQI